jgi:hypothetical protein
VAQFTHQYRFARRFLPRLILLLLALVAIILFCASFRIPQKVPGVGLLLLKGGLKQVLSPATGTIESFVKEEGDVIKLGDIIAYIRDHADQDVKKPIIAHTEGIIAEIIAYPDTLVAKGQAIAIMTNHGDVTKDLELIGFVSSLEGKKITRGMDALIDPSIINPHVTGHLVATVKRVGKLPMSKAAIQSVIKIPEVAHYIRDQINAEPFVVVLSLKQNESHQTGYAWTGPGPNFALDSGIIADIFIITEEASLAERLFPSIFRFRGGA